MMEVKKLKVKLKKKQKSFLFHSWPRDRKRNA